MDLPLYIIVLWLQHCVSHGYLIKNSVKMANDDSINFLVLGDWGGLPLSPYSTAVEQAIAKQMGVFANTHSVAFVLALGDNFYFSGVQDVDDPRFQETYNSVFNDKSLNIDWFFIAGNHDHNGNVTAQIEYSNVEKRWNFPKPYYGLEFDIGSTSKKIDIVMLDTVDLCGNSDDDALGLQPPGPQDNGVAEQQWAWIETMLRTSTAEYLIVAGHYPVWSVSSHGPTKCLVDRLLPLLHKYRVNAYFCGHDHNLQHLSYAQYNNTVDYFVSGAANFIDDSQRHSSSVPQGSLKFFWADVDRFGGYGYVEAGPNTLTYTFYDAGGKPLYSHIMTPRHV